MKTLKNSNKLSAVDKRFKTLEDIFIIQARSAAIGEMLGMIAHQWRQPLGIMGMVTNKMKLQARSTSKPNQELLNDIAAIDRNINYLANTIDDFKDFFKPVVEKEWHLASNICEKLRTLTYPLLKAHNVKLEIILNDNRELHIYGSELIQVLLSLVSNAKDTIFEQHREDGKIIILCEDIPDKGEYRLSVSDNGGGIQSSVLETLFEPYISTKGTEGTGLGLYMTKTIIEKHFEGTVRAENIDNGACFTLQFPTGYQETV